LLINPDTPANFVSDLQGEKITKNRHSRARHAHNNRHSRHSRQSRHSRHRKSLMNRFVVNHPVQTNGGQTTYHKNGALEMQILARPSAQWRRVNSGLLMGKTM